MPNSMKVLFGGGLVFWGVALCFFWNGLNAAGIASLILAAVAFFVCRKLERV